MVFGFRKKKKQKDFSEERDSLVEVFISAKNDLLDDNKLTIERTCEEIKKELRENINTKVENAIYKKADEYENNLKKRNEDYLNQLKGDADNYFGAVLTQYQLVIDEAGKSVNEIKSIIEKSNESYKNLENKIEEIKKVVRIEEVEKILNYKEEINQILTEIKSIYEKKDKAHKDLIEVINTRVDKIEKDYIEQQNRLENQISLYLKEIEQMKK